MAGKNSRELEFTPITDSDELRKLKSRAEEMFDEALEMMNSTDGWKLNKEGPDGAVIHTKRSDKTKRTVFRIQGVIKLGQKLVHSKFFSIETLSTMAEWNETLELFQLLQDFSDDTYLTYQVTKQNGPGGMISCRDLVYLRKDKRIGDANVTCYESAKLPSVPPVKNTVRADAGPSCIKIEPSPSGNPDECLFTWLVDLDFKLQWFPEAIFNQIFQYILFENLRCIRERAVRISKGAET